MGSKVSWFLKHNYICYTLIHHIHTVIRYKPSDIGWVVDTDDGAASTVWISAAKAT